MGAEKMIVSQRWAAPEVLSKGSRCYSQASDVWSFGVVLWEMLSGGRPPWPGLPSQRHVSRKEMTQHLESHSHQCPPGTPDWMVRLLHKCFRKPEKRPRMPGLLDIIVKKVKQLSSAKSSQYRDDCKSPES